MQWPRPEETMLRYDLEKSWLGYKQDDEFFLAQPLST